MLTDISLAAIPESPITDPGGCATPSNMPLQALLEGWDRTGTPYQLVMNDDGVIDGLVDLRQVQKLLSTDNVVERLRWETVTVGAIAETVFAVPHDVPPQAEWTDAGTVVGVRSIGDSHGRVAIVADGETYVSWSRISEAMRQHHFDPVTNLSPRITFNRRLREELDRASRSQQSLTVLLIDLDHFKEINDCFGHRTGDQVLRSVAKCLSGSVRSYDFVARYGGDEFTVICYDCGPADIRLPVIRLQRCIAALPPIDAWGTCRVSLSIGAAVFSTVDEHCSPEIIIEQADACLYQAKRSGRSTTFAVELDPFGIPVSPAYEIVEEAKEIANL